MKCYWCGSPEIVRIAMTADEKLAGMDMFQCQVCNYYQNHAGEADGDNSEGPEVR